MSKLRYGLQLCTAVRLNEDEKKNENTKATQIAQNKVLRLMDGSRVKDKRNIKDMLEKFDMLSVNQTAAQIKLTEAWKASQDPDYPVRLMENRKTENGENREVRTNTRREMQEGGRLKIIRESFCRDTGRLWNRAPKEIKQSISIQTAKKEIKKYCKTLPI